MCRLIILSKLFSRNDARLIGLKFFAVVWVAFPALGMKTTFGSCHAFGSYPTARLEWKIFSTILWLFVLLVGCVPVLSRPVPAICMV